MTPPPLWKLDIPRDVHLMKMGWAILLPVLAFLFIYFIGEMKDVRGSIAGINTNVAVQAVTMNEMSNTLSSINQKLDRPAEKPAGRK